jgi:NADH dehydrogenase
MGVPSRRVVIVGAGNAGLGTAVRLARRADSRLSLELVDGRAEHQLITRLHEVAAGRLAPAAAAVPLSDVLGGTGVGLRQAWIERVDLPAGRIETSSGRLEYDTLVLAPGSETDVGGVSGATEHALPLRTLDEAVQVRTTLLRRFERAASLGGSERRSSLTILVVGGGYTGVELAAELATWLPRAARRYGMGRPSRELG